MLGSGSVLLLFRLYASGALLICCWLFVHGHGCRSHKVPLTFQKSKNFFSVFENFFSVLRKSCFSKHGGCLFFLGVCKAFHLFYCYTSLWVDNGWSMGGQVF